MWMFLVWTYRKLIWMIHVRIIYDSWMENNLYQGKYFLFLLSDPCMGLILQLLCGEQNLHRQFQILDINPVLMIYMCGLRILWNQMVSSIAIVSWYTHMIFWWYHIILEQSMWVDKVYILNKDLEIKKLTLIQGGT